SPQLMFEQAFRNIDDILRKEAGCTTELDYTEPTSWLLFLKFALLSPPVFTQATIGSTGDAQKTVSLSVLRRIKVPKLERGEQKLIAARLDSLAAETQRLASLYERKLAALEALKKSLL